MQIWKCHLIVCNVCFFLLGFEWAWGILKQKVLIEEWCWSCWRQIRFISCSSSGTFCVFCGLDVFMFLCFDTNLLWVLTLPVDWNEGKKCKCIMQWFKYLQFLYKLDMLRMSLISMMWAIYFDVGSWKFYTGNVNCTVCGFE